MFKESSKLFYADGVVMLKLDVLVIQVGYDLSEIPHVPKRALLVRQPRNAPQGQQATNSRHYFIKLFIDVSKGRSGSAHDPSSVVA